ncbi:acyltransferase family protein [Blastococcus tunisiensis]|uniref:Peptidoglycan/LPS O-acetylase OafA/YrhL, contains acyltransferase and SGNH-hydrolase domains n=1 Tax=Blastococcus tunisiensis TaxID=1798228 RepID=A0A1I2JE73_9ACTN|nr:acyltransferase [Blastococcus sp. DSM 46838]SFF51156.1 Peptidoglycan/LPS O-acetylase OafA/YrhL, contains acyltransferase and SGNH-hydrolase domains [Blastococcus sp. DSM 46838]
MRAQRYAALDGLRGFAAVVVVVFHAGMAAPVLAGDVGIEEGHWSWWAAETPLHLFWAGPQAVYLFFVLSGFVLTLPFLRRPRPSWLGYYPRRLVRLYLPVWASLAVAVGLYFLFPRESRPGASWWINAHDMPLTRDGLQHDLSLLEWTTMLNSPLWSLQWEVYFSLLLPVYVLLAALSRRVRFLAPVLALALLGLTALGESTLTAWLVYLPMFGLGTLLAAHREEVGRLLRGMRTWAWGLLLVVALLLVETSWLPSPVAPMIATPLSVAGAALVVCAFLYSPGAVRVGEFRVSQWIGRRSFSLYLVHEPVLVSLAVVLATTNPAVILGIGLPLAVLASAVFYRLVEAPAHRFSGQVGRAFGGGGRSRAVTPPAAAAPVAVAPAGAPVPVAPVAVAPAVAPVAVGRPED